MPLPGTLEIPPWVPASLRVRAELDAVAVTTNADPAMLDGLSCWAMLFIEPWLAGIQRAETCSAHWLRETASAMSECLHERLISTPSIDRAI